MHQAPSFPISATDTYQLDPNITKEQAESLKGQIETLYQGVGGTEASASYDPALEIESLGRGETERFSRETEELLEDLEEVPDDKAIYLVFTSSAAPEAFRAVRNQAVELDGVRDVIPDSSL